ncbi:MAG: hypothetical protein P0S94_01530, partial [Simkaniaceae bacterium]|nr:hypothetical protein [Simkaniaceae bacterium]
MIVGVTAVFAQGEMQEGLSQMAASSEMAKSSGPSAIFMITPADRAKDYKDAFDYLRKVQPSAKPSFMLKDKTTLTNISSIDISTGGSLLIFKIATTQGLKYKVVKVEEIDSITP